MANGSSQLTSSATNLSPLSASEPPLYRPFRLESLGIPPSNSKAKRKKGKVHSYYNGNWGKTNTLMTRDDEDNDDEDDEDGGR